MDMVAACLGLGAIVLGVVAIHEFGHFATAKFLHIPVQEIAVGLGPQLISAVDAQGTRWCFRMIPIGGRIVVKNVGSSAGMLVFFSSGILANLLFSAVLYLLSISLWADKNWREVNLNDAIFVITNLAWQASLGLAIFNLIPIGPLDGAKMVSSLKTLCDGR